MPSVHSATATRPPAFYADGDSPGGFRHIPALDGIRGLAILLILGNHLLWSNYTNPSTLFSLLIDIRRSLWIGVALFFALSGFLITGILRDTLHQPHFFRTFYARRALRVFPLYYGVLFVLFALTLPLHLHWNHWQWFYLTYTANLALGQMSPLILPHLNISHFWSLQVEEQFYLLWPLVVFRIRSLRTLILTASIGCLIVLATRTLLVLFSDHLTRHDLTMSPSFSCADDLLFGCILALLLRSHHRDRALAAAPRIFALCAVAIFLMALTDHGLRFYNSPIQQTLGASLIGIASASLIAMSLIPTSRTARLFDLRLLHFFGKYSYGLYVFHYSLDALFTHRLRTAILTHTHSKAAAVAGGALIVAALSVLIAWLSYNLYEKHFLKLKRFFPNRPEPKPAAPL
jgi:peptidoglycan/LPS O-acetylase OafA/YrhL